MFVFLLMLGLLAGCERPDPEAVVVTTPLPSLEPPLLVTRTGETAVLATPLPGETAVAALPGYAGIPTPDPPHAVVTGGGAAYATHTVNAGETLGYIAQLYGSSIEELQGINQLSDTNLLRVGQSLLVPTQSGQVGPDFKIIPDSELVYGPAAAGFDVRAVAQRYGGYLLRYQEAVEGQPLGGPEIVALVAHRYSVNPRLLLAALEYRAGWLTQPAAAELAYPMGYVDPRAEGLYKQLSWAANWLNWGFYGRAEAGITSFLVGEATRLAYAPTINHGTAGVQTMLGAHPSASLAQWQIDVGPDGLFATYGRLFGNPFAYTVDPLWPAGLAQPALQLPWSSAETWYFTGGPHGGWAGGSAWAALDFAPPSEQFGCIQSDYWVTSMADGVVTRSDFGAVVVDMDGDGYAGTGWALLYMHVETRDRVPVGTWLQTGDRIGHPSCEGGFSGGTHL
ncbi:MAG: LysM peptidoglycan-binding domain-containing protein, partial [Anaerolineales bacterium]|nr:LysM peptidoglycan-binding domain-containing protein [Anaerolineales bacterium]